MSETPTSTEPPPTLPRTARIASRLGTFAPVCAIVGVLLIHVGFIPPLGGFMFFQIALLCGLHARDVGPQLVACEEVLHVPCFLNVIP